MSSLVRGVLGWGVLGFRVYGQGVNGLIRVIGLVCRWGEGVRGVGGTGAGGTDTRRGTLYAQPTSPP